ncbi:MAG: M14 family zinc carboxypeptidase [Planctomycetota bacterium]|jgi:hypothetical protein
MPIALISATLSLLAILPATQEAAPDAAPEVAPEAAREAAPDSGAPGRYLDHAELHGRLDALAAAHGGLARVEILATSVGGLPIPALVLGDPAADPGVMLVSGLDGRRLLDSALLLRTAELLLEAEDAAERLAGSAVVIVPRANPDGAEALLGNSGPAREQAGNARSDDRDRDGRTDEDGPSDLDGDGLIAWMRVPDPEGEWVIDEHDPRAMRKAKTSEGERGTHRLLIEGLDDDGDGAENEDGADGVEPDRNFPHRWEEHSAGVGAYQLSEPEARGLVDWVLAHPRVAAVIVVGAQDTLVKVPKAATNAKSSWRGYAEPLDGPLKEDVETLEELGRRFAELHEELEDKKHGVKGDGLTDGSFLAWVYQQAGRWGLGLKVWEPPKDLPKPDKKKKDEAEDDGEAEEDGEAEDEPEGEEAKEEEKEEEKDKPTSDAGSPVPAAVLAWLDAEHGGDGFIPWHEHEHPEHGTIEIGGLAPGVMINPPIADAVAMADTLAAYLHEILDDLPRVVVQSVEVRDDGAGLYTVDVALANEGVLPSASVLASKARTTMPLRVTLELPDGVERLSGPRQELVYRLAGAGGREEYRWVVSGTSGQRLMLRAVTAGLPAIEQEVVLP